MRTLIISIICSFLFFVNIKAQQIDYSPAPRPKNCTTVNSCPRNTLFHETNVRFKNLLGLNSVNWDHILVCREKYLVSVRLGIDYMSFNKISSAGIPIDLNLMVGGGALMLETGIGLNYLYVYKNYNDSIGKYKDNVNYLGLTGRIGLRYEKQHSIFFRLGYTPMYSLINYKEIPIIANKKYISMFGAGVGYTF
jgi:hypothetical protein